jgi:hypothetical protein
MRFPSPRPLAALLTTFLAAGLCPALLAAAPAVKPLACKDAPGLDPLLAPGTTLLLGEMHGTEESPAFVTNAVCRALSAGHGVTLGLEIPREEEPRFATYLASPATEKDRAALVSSPFWSEAPDGRSSRAMLALVDEVRRFQKEGRPVRLVLFDQRPPGSGAPDGQVRDRAMAERLRAAIRESPKDVLIALSGNIHSRTVPGVPWNKELQMMGFLLSQDFPGSGLIALDVAYSGGAAWVCMDGECRAHTLKGSGSAGTAGKVTLHEGGVDERGFHGRYDVGTLSPSEPAVPSAAKAAP